MVKKSLIFEKKINEVTLDRLCSILSRQPLIPFTINKNHIFWMATELTLLAMTTPYFALFSLVILIDQRERDHPEKAF